jgi:hypothetical protein
MDENINIEQFTGGYFIHYDRIDSIPYADSDDLKVTFNSTKSLKMEIIEMIRNAQKSIKLCSFIVSDSDVFNELNEVLKTKNIAVFILTQLDTSKLSATLLSEEERSPNFNQKHIDYISILYGNGAHVRAAKAAHAKFLISDDEKGLLMSSNMTEPSLNTNPESGVIIDSSDSLAALVDLFDIIFQYGTEYTKFKSASKDKQFVVSRDVMLKPEWIKDLSIHQIKFTWGDMNNSLYRSLVETINEASSDDTVLISTYSVVGLGNIPELIEAIDKHVARGGTIKLFCRGMNYRPDHLRNCTILANKGVQIFGDLYNHSKGLITDSKAIIFTANIDGNHGLINGFEVGFVLGSSQREALNNFILYQMENAPYKFELNPLKSAFFSTYEFYLKEKNITPPVVPNDLVIEVDSESIKKEILQFPAYLLYDQSKKVVGINIGEQFYSATLDNGRIEIRERTNRVFGLETYLLRATNIEIKTVKKTIS